MGQDLVVLTVNYCCADEIIGNMPQVLPRILSAGGEYWIVDNASPDDSRAKLRGVIAGVSQPDKVRLIESPTNGGFGAGNNVALREILASHSFKFVYFLNPDAVPDEGAIETMRDYLLRHPQVGLVGSALRDVGGARTASMFRFPSFLNEIDWAFRFRPVSVLLRRYNSTLPFSDDPTPADWVAGTSFMARTEVLRQVGLFDEDFFLYWEEIELCHRVRRSGHEIHGLPAAVVTHVGGVSTGMHQPLRRVPSYWHESRNTFFHKTGRGGPVWLLNAAVAAGLLFMRLRQKIQRRPHTSPHLLRDHVRYALADLTRVAARQGGRRMGHSS